MRGEGRPAIGYDGRQKEAACLTVNGQLLHADDPAPHLCMVSFGDGAAHLEPKEGQDSFSGENLMRTLKPRRRKSSKKF